MSERDDMKRLEGKVDALVDAVGKLVLIEERQSADRARLEKVEARSEKTERDLAMWVNRGWGAWLVVTAIFSVITAIGWKRPPDSVYGPPAYQQQERNAPPARTTP